MSTRTLLTIEQFERLPKPDVGSYELERGELIYVSTKDLRHNRVRDKLYMPLREFVFPKDWVRRRQKRFSSLHPARLGPPMSPLWLPIRSEMSARTAS